MRSTNHRKAVQAMLRMPRKWCIPFALAMGAAYTLLPGFPAVAGAAPPAPQEVPVKAIIEFKQSEEGPLIYADLLAGVDLTQDSWHFMDMKGHNIKVGMFAEVDPDGTKRNIRYNEKVLCPKKIVLTSGQTIYCDIPEQRYLRESLRLVKKHIWYEDLKNFYKRKLKYYKSERDKALKVRMLGRLVNWCNSNFLFKEAEKAEKDLERLGGSVRKEEEQKPAATEEEKKEEEAAAEEIEGREREIMEAFKALPDAGEVIVLSSPHIVLVSDHLPQKVLHDLLLLGERVIEDFEEFMYDASVPDAQPIPEEEILRIFHIDKMTTFEAALRKQGSLSPSGNITDREDLKRILQMGGNNSTSLMRDKSVRTGMTSHERGDPNDPRESNRDYEDHLVHQLGHTLIANRLLPKSVVKSRRPIMPWLGEGMAVYMTIKHLGSKNCACVDFNTDKGRYAEQGNKKEVKFRAWDADIEATVNQIALDDSAEKFDVIIRIPTYTRIGPENLSKSFSMIDFMIENDRVGFLMFLQGLQEHYDVLFKENDGAKFLRGLDELVAKSFTGAAIKMGRKVVPLDSMETLEAAWREWATSYVLKRK